MGLSFPHLFPSVPIFSHPGGGLKAELMPFGCVPGRNYDSVAIVSHFVPFLTFRRQRICRGGNRAGVEGWGRQGLQEQW